MAKKSTKSHHDPVATRQADVAAVLGVSTRQFRTYLEQGCPGSPGKYDLREIVPWVRDNVWKKDQTSGPDEDDPLLNGVYTPALERFRMARAEQEELRLAEQKGELVQVEELEEKLTAAADILRASSETLAELFGEDCHTVISEALDEIDDLFRSLGESGDGTRSGAA